jgi:hypothetical protein
MKSTTNSTKKVKYSNVNTKNWTNLKVLVEGMSSTNFFRYGYEVVTSDGDCAEVGELKVSMKLERKGGRGR